MKRLWNMLKGNVAVLLAAGTIYLFAMACSQSPTAPTAGNENPSDKSDGRGYELTDTPNDTVPPR
jgi:hypothetical protein